MEGKDFLELLATSVRGVSFSTLIKLFTTCIVASTCTAAAGAFDKTCLSGTLKSNEH